MAVWAPSAAAESQGGENQEVAHAAPGPHLDKPSPRIVERSLGRSVVVLFVFVFLLGPGIGGRWVCQS
jgi:hypothetical protein